MEDFTKVTSDTDDKHKAGPMSAYRHYVLSSVLPDAERKHLCMQKKNEALERENEILKKKVEFLTTDAEQFKAERQRIHTVIKNRDHQRSQLLHCKNELSVLGKKLAIQETDLRRGHKQKEALKEELELMKKELQSLKQGSVNRRAEQQQLKDRLDQVIKERDGLSDTLLRCKNECSELRDKISTQQSSVNRKDSRCKEQLKLIHLLKLEKQKLEKERGIIEAEEQRLNAQKEKLREIKRCRAVEDQIGKQILMIQQRSNTVRPIQEVPVRKLECLQKELLAQTEELRKTQALCEELKDKLTPVVVQLQQCQATVRKQKEKLMAVTAERNMYQRHCEELGIELADMKKEQRSVKQHNRAAKREKKTKLSSANRSSQSHLSAMTPKLKPGGKLNSSPNNVQMQSELRIAGTKI